MPVLVHLGEHHVALAHDGVDVEHGARQEALEQEVRRPIAEGLDGGPQGRFALDLLDAQCWTLRCAA
jgi:hypothetical protein